MTRSQVRFTGGALPLFGRLLATIIGLSTLVAGPWILAWFMRWFCNHLSTENDHRLQSGVTGKQLLWRAWLLSALSIAIQYFLDQHSFLSVIATLNAAEFLVAFSILRIIVENVRSTSGTTFLLNIPDWLKLSAIVGWFLSTGLIGYVRGVDEVHGLDKTGLCLILLGVLNCLWVIHRVIDLVVDNTTVWSDGPPELRVWPFDVKYEGTFLWFVGCFCAFLLYSLPLVTLPWSLRWLLRSVLQKVSVRYLASSDGEIEDEMEEGRLSPVNHESADVAVAPRVLARAATVPSSQTEAVSSGSPVMSWRKISLLATPVMLGLINLVDAYVAKEKDIQEGDQIYRSEVESGAARAKAIIEEASTSGAVIKQQLIDGALKEHDSMILGSTLKGGETYKQGLSESDVSRLQAEKTREMIRRNFGRK